MLGNDLFGIIIIIIIIIYPQYILGWKCDGLQDVYVILKYHHTGYIVITKGKIFYNGQTWQSSYSGVQI